jgi:choice-of-anchor B domain-containing protein
LPLDKKKCEFPVTEVSVHVLEKRISFISIFVFIMRFFLFLQLIISSCCTAQIYSSYNMTLLNLLTPNNFTATVNKYSGCWGWYQASKNREYAISGASHGTYFIDITNPITPTVCGFVKGSENCVWREMKTYRHYCYIVSDVCTPNQFQIVDLQYLPDSVHVVYSSNQYLELGHTIWIDTTKARMYVASTRFADQQHSPMTIHSLANPEAPVLLKRVEEDIQASVIAEVHDMWARNDTVYVSAAWKGIKVLKYSPGTNTLTLLGEFSDFPQSGYNHSSFLTQNGKYLVFCEEVPSQLPIHVVDVQNLSNIQDVVSFHPFPYTTPHNPFVIGNKWAFVSSYMDGLFLYDISDPKKISLAGFFDTYWQGGENTGDYTGGAYAGNWGAYPFLPSKIVIANDMQNGVFLLDASAAYTTSIKNPVDPVGLQKRSAEPLRMVFFPDPARDYIFIHAGNMAFSAEVVDLTGRVMLKRENLNSGGQFDLSSIPDGIYFLKAGRNGSAGYKKLVISR